MGQPQNNIADQHPALVGFEKINRYWDKTRNTWGAKLLPGEYYVTIHDEVIVTVLGSCISACIRDRKLGVGGMNHFMLPQSGSDPSSFGGAAERYGNVAMEHLINTILKQGGRRENLEAKIFGGGKIIVNMTDVGSRNIEFVREYLDTEKIRVESEDVGDLYPRKVAYFPASGRAQMKRLRSLHNDTVVQRERDYQKHIKKEPDGGDVELF